MHRCFIPVDSFDYLHVSYFDHFMHPLGTMAIPQEKQMQLYQYQGNSEVKINEATRLHSFNPKDPSHGIMEHASRIDDAVIPSVQALR